MVYFKNNDIKLFTDTCKFWKVVSKNPKIKDYYIGYTSGSNHCCALDENEDFLFNHYWSLDIMHFVEVNDGWDEWTIEFIEECPWQNREHAYMKQKELIAKSPNATINHCKRCRTKEKEAELAFIRKERRKQYEEDNFEKIYARKTRLCVCDVCGSHYQHGYKSKHIKTKTHQKALHEQNQQNDKN